MVNEDVRCAAALEALSSGDIERHDRANRCDMERAWRLVIALLDDDETAKTQLGLEVGDCPDCLRAWSTASAGLLAGFLHGRGGREIALKTAKHMLAEVLDHPPILDGP